MTEVPQKGQKIPLGMFPLSNESNSMYSIF